MSRVSREPESLLPPHVNLAPRPSPDKVGSSQSCPGSAWSPVPLICPMGRPRPTERQWGDRCPSVGRTPSRQGPRGGPVHTQSLRIPSIPTTKPQPSSTFAGCSACRGVCFLRDSSWSWEQLSPTHPLNSGSLTIRGFHSFTEQLSPVPGSG